MIKKGLSFTKLLKDYSQWCTVVCLNKIVTSAKWLASIYAIIFVLMVVLFIAISVNVIIKFFKYPSSTELKVNVDSQKFPLLSFCNENPMKRSIVDSDPAYAEISKMLKQYEDFELKTITKDDYGFSTSTMAMQRLSRARIMLRLMMHKLSESDRRRAGYSYTELVTECTFMGKTCTSADFVSFLHPDYGVCYSFVSNRDVTRPGTEQGLRMMMTVNQDSPRFTVFDFLPTTDSATIRAIVHFPEDFPDFSKNGFKIGASTDAMIAISKVNNGRLHKPYSNCTNPGEEPANYYTNFTYTFNSCQYSSLQRLAWDHCKCVDPLYRKGDEHTYCSTPTDMLCLVKLMSHVNTANSMDGRHFSDCKPPCIESSLQKTVTYGVFPSAKYKVAVGTQVQRDVLLDTQGGGRQGDGDEDSDNYDHADDDIIRATDLDAFSCRADYPEYYNNNKFTVIQGYPCKSKKKCKSCVMFVDPLHPTWDWPCSYYGYTFCSKNNLNSSTNHIQCSKFFEIFDFIPTGVNMPNIPNWDQGKGPTPCNWFTSGCPAMSECARNSSKPDIRDLKTPSSLIDINFIDSNIGQRCMTTCDLQKQAKIAAKNKLDKNSEPKNNIDFCSTPEGRIMEQVNRDTGRKKRSVIDSSSTTKETPTANGTVDKPGYGSCEYANKNFKGAAECIKWYKRNGLMFELYYETLQYQSYTQGPSYSLVSMLSDVAGHAGLWLGLSMVSLVEFVGLFMMIINKFIRGDKIVVDEDPIGGEVANRKEQVRKSTLHQRYSASLDED